MQLQNNTHAVTGQSRDTFIQVIIISADAFTQIIDRLVITNSTSQLHRFYQLCVILMCIDDT